LKRSRRKVTRSTPSARPFKRVLKPFRKVTATVLHAEKKWIRNTRRKRSNPGKTNQEAEKTGEKAPEKLDKKDEKREKFRTKRDELLEFKSLKREVRKEKGKT